MKPMIFLLAATALSAPALAQSAPATAQADRGVGPPQPADPHAGHETPADPHAGHDMAADHDQGQADPHAGHSMPANPQAQPPTTPPERPDSHAGHEAPADPHAGHDMGADHGEGQTGPHAGHAMPAEPPAQFPASSTARPDPHAGHSMPEGHGAHGPAQADPHAGHVMPAAPAPAPAAPPAEAHSGPVHAADSVFGEARMAAAREALRETHGDVRTSRLLIDRFEARLRDGDDGYLWDAQFWWGGDVDKLWLKTEGEGVFDRGVESAEVQGLWSRAIDPWFDLQVGVRHDFRPAPDRTHLVVGFQGLAPYWFEIDGALFLSHEGEVSARLEAEYDLRLTPRLIAQPQAELELAAQDMPELGVGAGLSTAELGLRLRYEIAPEFAPYVGIAYERAFGDTADYWRAEGEDAGGWSLLLGLRAWF
ncbi:copper resistance protein B [Sphingosinicella sp. CPCC 101087]|uniref:copper resistance protein B n=1 Tax=Sphingosinicella sp. CPCC 101087 TaxID=2497754 RepID=UPI001FB0A6FE|nr:copper resistance protein B [Sphingosinicella sp. CPCC 101087]